MAFRQFDPHQPEILVETRIYGIWIVGATDGTSGTWLKTGSGSYYQSAAPGLLRFHIERTFPQNTLVPIQVAVIRDDGKPGEIVWANYDWKAAEIRKAAIPNPE